MSSTMSDVADVARFGGLGRIEYFCQSLGIGRTDGRAGGGAEA